MQTCKVISLLKKQHELDQTCTRRMYCRDCGYQEEMILPHSMKAQNVPCPGCYKTGFMSGWRLK